MSDKEKDLVAQISELPAEVQDRFLLMAQGAAVALDSMKDKSNGALMALDAQPKKEEPEDAKRES